MAGENSVSHKKNHGGLDALVDRYKAAHGKTDVAVGFLRSSGKHKNGEGMTVATVARNNEFGQGNTPERSFMRTTLAAQKKKLKKMMLKLAKQMLLQGASQKWALGVLGSFLATEIKKTIDSNVPPPNAESTIARKGSNKTLVDTHQMLDSVDWEVRKEK